MEENLQDGCYFTIALILGLYSIFLGIHKRGAACIEKDKNNTKYMPTLAG